MAREHVNGSRDFRDDWVTYKGGCEHEPLGCCDDCALVDPHSGTTDPEKPTEPTKPIPRVSAARQKPERSPKQTQRGKNHPGSSTKTAPTKDGVPDQNEHMWKMLNMRDLPPGTFAVGSRLNSYAYGWSEGGTGKVKIALDTLASHCSMSRRALDRHVAELRKRGLFAREDHAKGGRGGRGKAVLRATLPAWHDG